jgi:cobalt-zinc-cadmium efflux system outer membrane protein
MRIASVFIAGGLCALALTPAHPARALSLEEALARASRNRFEITSISRDLKAGEGRIRQASVKPAAELDVESRNFFEETAVEMSILHERGGKREARIATARADLALVGAQAEVRRLDVGHEVRTAYTAVLAAERSLALADEAHALARSLADTVAEKVRAGAASPIEETRAAVRLHGAAAEVERARREVAVARAGLALAVGDPAARAEPVEGRLPEDTTVPDLAALTAQLPGTPDAKILEQELFARRSVFAEEQAQTAVDMTWRASANVSLIDDEAWLVFGVTFPIFSEERNRGALAAASAGVERAEVDLAAAAQRRAAELERAHAGLQASAREAAILKGEVLAGAERAFATVQEGYRLGKFPYLDVLDASEVLLDARLQHAAALAALAQARVDVERVLGRTGLPSTSNDR